MLRTLVLYFQDVGRALNRTEYYNLKNNAPISPKLLVRYFGGMGYNSLVRYAKQSYPEEWSKIGVEPVVEKKAEPIIEQEKPVLEPASEDDLSPLEKLRSLRGGSFE